MAAAAEAPPTLRGGLRLFRFRGIRVFLHWTFLLLPAWLAFAGWREGVPWPQVAGQVGLVLIVFVCVLLHEFGHALTAQRYGIRTRDITLLPIGGMASLERMPEEPRQEFWITVAGPLVNLAIAALAFAAIAITGITLMFTDLFVGATTWTKVLVFLFSANVMLFLFNLVPAFPMDGGRILRSLLSMRMPREKATRIAALTGRLFAVAFAVIGLSLGQPFLLLIGLFVFFAAGAEARRVDQEAALRGITVEKVMRSRFWSMPGSATVRQAVDELLAGGDQDMLVMRDGVYAGVLTRTGLLRALSEKREQEILDSLSLSQAPAVKPTDPANAAMALMLSGQHPLLPVIDNGRVVGVLEPENIGEYMLVRQALEGQR